MIIFNELRISNDAKDIIVDARVRKDKDSSGNPYFKDVYIDQVFMVPSKEYKESPNEYNERSKTILWNSEQNEQKEKEVCIRRNISELQTIDALDFSTDLYFIYVKTTGAPSINCPCGTDEVHTIGVTMYMGDIYTELMGYFKNMTSNNCEIPQALIDRLLQLKALTTAIDSCHYTEGINYYNQWFSGKNSSKFITTNCGCHG